VGRIRIVVLLMVAGAAAACTTPKIVDPDVGAGGPGNQALPAPVDARGVGVDLVPLRIPVFIFGSPTTAPKVQAGSEVLVGVAGTHDRLEVRALPSGRGTAAVDFLETSTPTDHWGEVMFPAERTIFRTFARNRSLGSYLVMLTDVDVIQGPDPIPLTAYRWARADVEAYAGCGIPDMVIDACTQLFFMHADTRIVSTANLYRGV
jgi:hypothetical protein